MKKSSTYVPQLGTYFWVAACGYVALSYFDALWSGSADLAHHYALVARLAEHGHPPVETDPSLQLMQTYPRHAHMAAAAVALIFGSPFAGMQAVTIASLLLLWTAIGLALLSLPDRPLLGVSVALTLFLVVNHWI